MNKAMRRTQIALTGALLLGLSAMATNATTLRAFVSSTGNDANAGTNCAQTAPCRTFAAAFPTVTAGGELIALDTAGYGPLTGANSINKAITIATIPGATAFVVVATGTAGFTISAGAGDLVILRNINFNGSNAASTTGIQHNSGKLEVYDSKFAQLTTGISLTNSKADMYNCVLVGNTTATSVSGTGLDINGQGASTALLTVSGGSITNNGTAFFMTNPGNNPIFNIWVHGPSNQAWYTNVAHNTTVASGTGTGCPCTLVGTYAGGTVNPK